MKTTQSTLRPTFDLSVDTMDWGTNSADIRERVSEALIDWFDGLSEKTQRAIYYAQIVAGKGYVDFNCPWLRLLADAEYRIKQKLAPWAVGLCGHNLYLEINDLETQY